jgi:putative mRNA 3-end processing factor
MPIYRWKPQASIAASMNSWWETNSKAGKTSLIAGYSLGKIQRLLQMLDPSIGPIYTHPAVTAMNKVMLANGWNLHPTLPITPKMDMSVLKGSAILCPPSVLGSHWTHQLGPIEVTMGSGWNAIRGVKKRSGLDLALVLSDHADWPGLLSAIAATGAERVYVTHGSTHILAQYLVEQGLEAYPAETEFEGETAFVPLNTTTEEA